MPLHLLAVDVLLKGALREELLGVDQAGFEIVLLNDAGEQPDAGSLGRGGERVPVVDPELLAEPLADPADAVPGVVDEAAGLRVELVGAPD